MAKRRHVPPYHKTCGPHDKYLCERTRYNLRYSRSIPVHIVFFAAMAVFRLRLENRDDTVSVDRLRPCYEDEGNNGHHQPPPGAVLVTQHSTELDPDVWPTLNNRPTPTVRRPDRLGFRTLTLLIICLL